jgi:hypothetical protein
MAIPPEILPGAQNGPVFARLLAEHSNLKCRTAEPLLCVLASTEPIRPSPRILGLNSEPGSMSYSRHQEYEVVIVEIV